MKHTYIKRRVVLEEKCPKMSSAVLNTRTTYEGQSIVLKNEFISCSQFSIN
jgi:hypothetical protein